MKCPNCGLESPDAEADCRRCGLVFAKWRAAAASASASAAGPRAQGTDEAPISLETLLLFALLLSVAAWYFLHGRAGGRPQALPDGAVQPREASAAGGAVENPCILEGEVLDVYRLRPVVGARVFFRPRFAGVTDGRGRYEVRVTAGSGYWAEFSHGDYQPNFAAGFSRNWREAPWDQRVRAARTVLLEIERGEGPSKAADYACDSGRRKAFNFALLPKELSDEEKGRIAAVQ
ncbi:MAG: hypothetical protein HY554_14040 [Elusimicrobia bacterium]|nr:hypothetical protein [Elusimicrobiota bacterium]